MAVTSTGHRHLDEEYPAEGLHSWVILVCLMLTALACFMFLRFTIDMMDARPSPSPPPTAARPTP